MGRGTRFKQQGFQITLDKIALSHAHGIEARLKQHLDGAQISQVTREHHLEQGFVIDDALKDLTQRLVVAALRGSGDPDHQRTLRDARPGSG